MRGQFVLAFFSFCLFSGILPVIGDRASPQSPSEDYGHEAKAIEHVLQTQQKAWNKHDLEGFMAGYWNSSELTFFAGAKENDGWQATLDRYLATYASPGHEMGTLEFSNLRIQVLGQQGAFARGAWKLTMSNGKTPHGLFTLVFRKFPDGWKIVHDHTSVSE
jgi:ketosteroid isomerase-like protein